MSGTGLTAGSSGGSGGSGHRFHYPGICHGCNFPNLCAAPLYRCSQCHLVMYCHRGCQARDWPNHKLFCELYKVPGGGGALQMALVAAAGASDEERLQRQREFLAGLRVTASLALGRRLHRHEEEALLFPRLCEVCGMTGPLGAGSGCCPDCCGVYYCCHDHLREDREQHRQWCELYKLCSCCNQQAKNREAITLPTGLDQEYRPLAPTMEEHILSLASRLRPVAVAGASESLTFPLTALYVLQQVWPGLATAPVLILHVVGAEDGREPRVAAPWEYLMHRLPVLARLHVLLVGPGLGGPQGCHRAALCQQCRDKVRQLVVECRRALYHNLAQATAAATPPPPCAWPSTVASTSGRGTRGTPGQTPYPSWPTMLRPLPSPPSTTQRHRRTWLPSGGPSQRCRCPWRAPTPTAAPARCGTGHGRMAPTCTTPTSTSLCCRPARQGSGRHRTWGRKESRRRQERKGSRVRQEKEDRWESSTPCQTPPSTTRPGPCLPHTHSTNLCSLPTLHQYKPQPGRCGSTLHTCTTQMPFKIHTLFIIIIIIIIIIKSLTITHKPESPWGSTPQHSTSSIFLPLPHCHISTSVRVLSFTMSSVFLRCCVS